ncbi:NAD(P)-dependent dehydrogenase (short-subunit alcohol dehydrogenase family) [Arthrobacter bambusae]|uniref:NAD(P)-dependent dehydrogenase (Short-subunit alcohol dehydrogenase family) n=1 Tax=Arthrobacter bambusae TaxID=1338426 RepID=A0ABV2P0W4_9MICC
MLWTADDMPSQKGRTAVVTGSNTGLGFATASALAARGASVILAIRNVDAGSKAAERIRQASPGARIEVYQLDLGSLASIFKAAQRIRAKNPRIDLLINNAGIMNTPKGTTVDGVERQFGINHLGHFALTGLLIENMLAVPASRVVTVSALAHQMARGIDFDDLQRESSYAPMRVYSQSKLMNILFTYELQRRLDQAGALTLSVAAHPGLASSELSRGNPATQRAFIKLIRPLIFQSTSKGALPTLRAATDTSVRGAQYYGPDGRWSRGTRGSPAVVESSAASHNKTNQRRLWAVSEELTGVVFPV